MLVVLLTQLREARIKLGQLRPHRRDRLLVALQRVFQLLEFFSGWPFRRLPPQSDGLDDLLIGHQHAQNKQQADRAGDQEPAGAAARLHRFSCRG